MANASSTNYAALAAFLITLVITFGVQFVAPNSEISDRYPTPLTPPGWAFSIWGLIFTSQAVMVVLLTLQPGSAKQDNVLQWLIAGWISESVWQLLFALETRISLALCAPVLIFGAFAFIRALLACSNVPHSAPKVSRFLLVTSTAINAAWLTVAASLAVLVALTASFQASLTPIAAALAVVVAAIGATLTVCESSAAYSLTLLWSFWGVHVKNGDGELVDILALGSSVLFAVLSIGVTVKNVLRKQQAATEEDDAADGETLLHT